jgi:SAM-dependent methyltransferase
MDESSRGGDPRWGQVDRDKKAEAILRTMELVAGPDAPLRQGTWLDVGCGSGGVAAALAANVHRVIGIDPEPWQRWPDFARVNPNLEFHAGSYARLAEVAAAESIDVVVCNQVYEHVDDPLALLAAIHRVLRPGGVCYFAGPNLLWPIEPHVFWPFVHWFPRRFAQRAMRLLGSRHAHELDAWSWSYWKLTRAFASAGFRWKPAVSERIRAGAAMRGSMLLRLAARVPVFLIAWLMPLTPAFVFVLTRPRASVAGAE